MAELIKHKTLLERVVAAKSHDGEESLIVFAHPDLRDTTLFLERETFDEMGEPEEVTVTIEPGNTIGGSNTIVPRGAI